MERKLIGRKSITTIRGESGIMGEVRMFSSMLFIVHDSYGNPYGTAKELEEAEKILEQQEKKCNMVGKLSILALGNEINK